MVWKTFYYLNCYDGILIFAPQKSECRKQVCKGMMGYGKEGKNFLVYYPLVVR